MKAVQYILVVDDHADTRIILNRALTKLGYQVTLAESCATARAAAEAMNWQIDLMLGDIGLPDGDGAELMAEFKGRCGCATVALTGYGSKADLERYAQIDVDRWLVKPIDLQGLKAAIAPAE